MITFRSTLPLKTTLKDTHLTQLPDSNTEPPGTEDTGLVDVILPSNSRNTTPDHLDDLEKKNPYLISRNPSDNSK